MKIMNRKRIAAAGLALLLAAAGCGTAATKSENLMKGVTETKTVEAESPEAAERIALTDFSLGLFRESLNQQGNTVISPCSVLYALAMTANGAEGETREQMEKVLGLPVDRLNGVLKAQMEAAGAELKLANGIWVNQTSQFEANPDLLALNADVYGAEIVKAPFQQGTADEINRWVNEKTAGRVPKILDMVPEDAVLYLVNALAFDGDWAEPYHDYQVQEGTFTEEDGTAETVEYMYNRENRYLADEKARGFLKYYDGGHYAFAALLPEEGVKLQDYVRGLTGRKLQSLLRQGQDVPVNTALPKFKSEYGLELSGALQALGMTDAFDRNRADLSRLGAVPAENNLSISRVLHKAFVAVDEKGTEAGAATVVEIEETMAIEEPEEIEEVYLTRPFLWMILDTETGLPVFIGTVETF